MDNRYELLFDDKFLEDQVEKIKVLDSEKLILKKWISQIEDGTINKEKEGYLKFYELFLQQLLGYNSDYITHERKAKNTNKPVEFSISEENSPEKVKAVIELKGVGHNLWGNTEKNKTPIEQAVLYGLNNKAELCLVSNYEDFYFFIPQKGTNEAYYLNIKDFSEKNYLKFKIFKYLLSKETFLKKQSFTKSAEKFVEVQKEFSKNFYKLFHETRKLLVYELEISNPGILRAEAVYYAQKILDRVIFICFAEDRTPLILDRNFLSESLLSAIKKNKNLWEELNLSFKNLNRGVTNALCHDGYEIPKINGGLFHEDLSQKLHLEEKRHEDFFKKECFENHKFKLKKYESELKNYSPVFKNIFLISSFDFESEINVNILGHIFENSLNDLEELKNEEISQRKKDGIFYTPEYITDYICRNTIIPYLSKNDSKTVEKLIGEYSKDNKDILELETKLKEIKIVDPACGSGAFLNKAVDVLFEIHKSLHDLKEQKGWFKAASQGRGKGIGNISLNQFSAEEEIRQIIMNNIYGVDLNPESVEITKLSLFLKVASRSHPLPSIDDNIKCGNSLISGINSKENFSDLNTNIEKLIKLKKSDKELYNSQKNIINFEYNENLKKYFGENWKEQNPFNWEIEFTEIFREGGFDVVVGNPPYVRIQNLNSVSEDMVKYYETNYNSAIGNFDIYALFIEKATKLIKNNSKIGYILPNKFFIANYGEPIRNYLIEGNFLKEIINFKDNQIFDGASTYTCLLFLEINKTKIIKYSEINRINSPILELNIISENSNYDNKNIRIGNIPYSELKNNVWNFLIGNTEFLLKKLFSIKTTLNDFQENFFVGLQTSGDSIYLVELIEDLGNKIKIYSSETQKEHILEKELTRKLIKGKDLNKYHINYQNRIIIFPYLKQNNNYNVLSEKELEQTYPLTYNYFKEIEQKIKDREKGKLANSDSWFALTYPRSINLYDCKKIITPNSAFKASFCLDEKEHYYMTCGVAGGFAILLKKDSEIDEQYLLSILNSKLMDLINKSIGTSLQGGYYSYDPKIINRYPIIKISLDKQKAFIEKTELLSKLYTEINKNKNKFTADISKKYNLDKLNSKLENFSQLSFESFLIEISKITKLKFLSAKERREFEDYWQDFFESEKKKICELELKISNIIKEIDKMVYNLYELTEGEIKIVEEFN